MNIYGLLGLTITLLLPTIVTAQDTTLEQGLLQSMSIFIDSEGVVQRHESSDKAIQAYMKQNYVNKTPNFRYDYTDHYVLKKPASLLGHDLKTIEEEYMAAYVGCCVSPGVGAIIKQKGSLERLQNFAKRNRCSIEPIDFNDHLESLNVKNTRAPRGNYYSISCRERELERD
jgi:hypothetical protein